MDNLHRRGVRKLPIGVNLVKVSTTAVDEHGLDRFVSRLTVTKQALRSIDIGSLGAVEAQQSLHVPAKIPNGIDQSRMCTCRQQCLFVFSSLHERQLTVRQRARYL